MVTYTLYVYLQTKQYNKQTVCVAIIYDYDCDYFALDRLMLMIDLEYNHELVFRVLFMMMIILTLFKDNTYFQFHLCRERFWYFFPICQDSGKY